MNHKKKCPSCHTLTRHDPCAVCGKPRELERTLVHVYSRINGNIRIRSTTWKEPSYV